MPRARHSSIDGEEHRRNFVSAGRHRHGLDRALRGGGRLIDWEIHNRPAKGITNGLSHFAVQGRAGRQGARRAHPQRPLSRQSHRRLSRRHLAQLRLRRAPRFARRHAAFRRQQLRGPLPGRQARFSRHRAVSRHRRAHRLQSVHPAQRPRLEHPRRDVRDQPSPTRPTRRSTYTAVGVVGHGLQPPTKARRVNRKGVHRRQGRRPTSPIPARRDYAEIVLATDSPSTSRQTHLYRGHWFDALEVYWKDLNQPGPFADRDYGTADIAGGMGRNRDSQPGRRPCRRARRARAGRCASRSPGTRPTSASTGSRRSGTSASRRPPAASGRTGTRPNGPAPRPIANGSARALERAARRDRSLPRRRLRLDAAACRCSTRPAPTSRILKSPTTAAARGRHLLRLGGLPSARPAPARELHPCLELPAGAALPVSRARALDARGRLQVQSSTPPAA